MKRRALCAGLVACGAAMGMALSAAGQQVSMSFTVSHDADAGGMDRRAVSRADVERYASLVEMSEEQLAAARTLQAGYEAEHRELGEAVRRATAEAKQKFESTHDPAALEPIGAAMRELRQKRAAIEERLFDDMRLLLTPEQDARWDRVERHRRRQLGMRGGSVSGERVDVVALVEEMKLGPGVMESLAAVLERYERELDALVQQKLALAEELQFDGGRIDMERIEEQRKRSRELGMRLRDLNERTVRVLTDLLPESRRDDAEQAFKRRAFPQVYRESHASKMISAAMGMGDLEAGQRQAIEDVRESYARESAAANERWARAIREADDAGRSGFFMSGGGGEIAISSVMGQQGESPERDARQARDEVDQRAKSRLLAILNPEQRERLPKEEPRRQEQFEFGAVQVIGGPG